MVSDEAPDAPDADLLSRLLDGEDAALGVLFDRYAPTLYPLAERLLGDPAAAEGVLDDVFSFVARQPASFLPSARNLAARLVRDVRSGCLARRRPSPWLEPSPGGDNDRLRRLARRVPAEEIHRARSHLMPCEWNVLELVYFRGLICAEVAARERTTSRQVARRLSCALDVLSFCLDEAWDALTDTNFLQRRLDALDHGVLVADPTGDLVLTNLVVRSGGGWEATGDVDTAEPCRYLHPDGSPVLCADLPLIRAIRRGEVVLDEPFSVCQGTTERTRTVRTASAPLYASSGLVAGGVMLCFPDQRPGPGPRWFDDFLAATSDSFLVMLAERAERAA